MPIDLGSLILVPVGFLILAGVVLGGWIAMAGRREARAIVEGAATTTAEVTQAEDRLRILCGGLQAVPPGGDDFLPWAETSMLAIARARTADRLSDVAGLLTPAYYEALLAEQRADPQPPAQMDIKVVAERVAAVQAGARGAGSIEERYDVVTVQLGATYVLHATADDGRPQTRTTVTLGTWRFVRAAGLPDAPDALQAARVCPNCGAPFGDDASGVCRFCGQVTVGNAHGWLVDHIDVQPLT